MAARGEVLRLYRRLLKLGRVYPSKNRAGMIEEIKTEFREAKGLSSHAEIEKKVEVARSGVQQMQLYCKLDIKGTDWKVSLDGGGANSSLEK
mmetsp:Transcript_2345/g.6492  ORF Transcript_2345/g.6492 Transcript_2345/m.6492 type:complete len:92 (-) Transcript_2345:104-379(-)